MLKQQLEQDIKTALLTGDKGRATVLRGLKSAILYVEVEQGKRQDGLTDPEIVALFAKEAKKRQESADLYKKGGNDASAEAELAEKAIIESYLPEQIDDEALIAVIDRTVADMGSVSVQDMGRIIAAVKQKTAGQADGARIAQLVKERLTR